MAHILFVDDDIIIRETLKVMMFHFTRHRFRVLLWLKCTRFEITGLFFKRDFPE